jgi:hypothetical protein
MDRLEFMMRKTHVAESLDGVADGLNERFSALLDMFQEIAGTVEHSQLMRVLDAARTDVARHVILLHEHAQRIRTEWIWR